MRWKIRLFATAFAVCIFGCTSSPPKSLYPGSGGSIAYGCFTISTSPVEGLEFASQCDQAMQIGLRWETSSGNPIVSYRLGAGQTRTISIQGANVTPVRIQAPQVGTGEVAAPGVVQPLYDGVDSINLYNSATRYVFVEYGFHRKPAGPEFSSGSITLRPGMASKRLGIPDPDVTVTIKVSEYEPY